MLSILYLACFLACGCAIVRCLLPRHPALNRLWLGCSLGLLLMMWLPALCALGLRFTMQAHFAALAPLALCLAAAYLGRSRQSVRGWDRTELRQLLFAMIVAVPLTALFAGLQITHVYLVNADGSWTVGQSTYGDLPMHTAFIAGMKNAAFPPEYTMYPGHRLSYPFLTDSLSTTFVLMGMSLQAATIVPAVLMFFLTCVGVTSLGRELSAGKRALLVGALFFFLNGGLGFLYDFDQAAGMDAETGLPKLYDRLETIMTGFYQTPANRPDDNLRWSNLIADLFVPQRTFLGGYSMVIPCFYLLFTVLRPGGNDDCDLRGLLLLGVWAGLMPLVHTHSFLALGLCSAGLMFHDLIAGPRRGYWILRYLIYAGIALHIAAPQLFAFTFHQALSGEGRPGQNFLQFQFNWVNNPNGEGMRDFYLWFWLKNAGLPFALVLFALMDRDPGHRRILAGAGAIWLIAELIRFQPNEYDNNKLFYLAWLLCCFVAADTLWSLFDRLRGLPWRWPALVGFLSLSFLTASLSLTREWISGMPGYQAFSAGQVAAADFIAENTDEDAVFLTASQTHLNPVDSVAGRTIVCGPDLWLWWHGFDTSEAQSDIRRFYADPAGSTDVPAKYGVDYVYYDMSYAWQDEFRYTGIDLEGLFGLYECVYTRDGIYIFRVPGN